MTIDFFVELAPSKELFLEVEAFAPTNPYCTHPYAAAQRLLEFEPIVLGLNQGYKLVFGCLGLIKHGRLNRLLNIRSIPTLVAQDLFWDGIIGFCQSSNITTLEVNTYFSPENTVLPELPGEIGRWKRKEFILDLSHPDLFKLLGKNHRRLVKKSRKAGLQIIRTKKVTACENHIAVQTASRERRKDRGENIIVGDSSKKFIALLKTGSGELFQATNKDDIVLSSVLLLMARESAILVSSGTSEEGMKCGAAHYLNYEISRVLQAESFKFFNLGGAADNTPGLQRYKHNFGTKSIKLEAAEFYLGSKFRRIITKMISIFRS